MFLTKFSADSGDRSPWGSFWFSPVPMRAGHANITPDNALQLTAVYACVRVLSDSVSTLPFQMYRQQPNGAKQQIRDHWLYRLFAKRPNDYQNPMEFRAMMQGHLALRGNAFAQIVSNGRGEVTDLHPIHPDRITIEMLSPVNWRFQVKNSDGSKVPIKRQDMFHIKGLSPDGVIGYNPVALARKMLGTGVAAQDFGLRYFENDATPSSGWIEHPNQFATKEKREQFRESWQEQQAGANKGKVAVLEYGLRYHPSVAISNADAQFIESKKYTRSEIASMFRVPPHMIGDLERATFSNIEQQSIDFVTHSLRPWLVCWEEAIKFNFLDPEDDDLCIKFPVMELLRGDMVARSAYINTGVMNGTLTRNEGRIMEDRDPLPGLDEPLRMVNMVNESDAESVVTNQGAKGDRLNALASAAAERIVRKEVEMVARAANGEPAALVDAYEKHAAFVAAALSIPLVSAQNYCTEQIQSAELELRDFERLARSRIKRLAIAG